MALKCPKCQKDLVNATHGTSRCPGCNGVFVPVSRVQELLAEDDGSDAAATPSSNDELSGRCPVDGNVMSRTDVSGTGQTPIHLERCATCKGVWFDAGEWAALSDAHLLDHLDELWCAEWRASRGRSAGPAVYEQRLEQAFGSALYAQIQALRAALRNHPRRSQALAVLREEGETGSSD